MYICERNIHTSNIMHTMNNEETKILNVKVESAGNNNSPQIQSLQGGKYRIEKILGQGGFGITYLATDNAMQKKVAIKEFFLKEFCSRDSSLIINISNQVNKDLVERYLQKFLKEAKTISKLNHTNIISLYDTFQENGTAYYVMEYIEGESLANILKKKGKLSEQEAVNYIHQTAQALDYLHNKNINHLDIKPSNIMVRKKDNSVVLIDFGGAKQYNRMGEQTSTTPIGISHGYAPIEQYNVTGVSSFSPQTDIYSLGATLYNLVTNNTPPQAGEVLNEGIPNLPHFLSQDVRNAITHAMQVRKSDRPKNIKVFLNIFVNNHIEEKKTIEERKTSLTDKIGLAGAILLFGTPFTYGLIILALDDNGSIPLDDPQVLFMLYIMGVGALLIFVWFILVNIKQKTI